jgi:glycosyltransferase involved in cell wall biosynthesis
MRLAYLVTHPIQYQAPLLRRIAAEPNIYLKVFFASDLSLRRFVDPGFSRSIRWDVPLLEGYEYEFLPAFGPKDQVSFWLPMSYGLAARLRAGRFDALWVHGYMRWHHWTAMVTAKRLGMKVVIRDEATATSSLRGRLKRTLKRPFFFWLQRIADEFMAIGSLNAEYYRKHGVPDEHIFMMPYAVDNAFFQARTLECADRRGRLRAELGLEPERPVILYAGKMNVRKRPGDLLEAYIRLSPDGQSEPRPYLLYAGDGEIRRELEEAAAATGWKSIRFLGFLNQSELPAYYDLCDIFVMPTVFEPWGLVVNEILNAGKPVIASDQVGCVPDLVRHGGNGFIFKAGDVADLARALRDILADPQRWAEMGRRSLEIIDRWNFEEDVRGLRAALNI